MINKQIKKLLTEKQIKKIRGLKLNLRPAEIRPEMYYKITKVYEMK